MGGQNPEGGLELSELVFEDMWPNAELLDEELRALGLAAYAGVSTGGGRVRVHLRGAGELERGKIRAALAQHDAAGVSARQRAAAVRQAARAALRKPWAAWTDADKDAFLSVLAAEMGLTGEE